MLGAFSVSFQYFSEIVDTYFRNKISLNMQKYIHKKSERLSILYYEIPQLKDLIERAQDAFCYGPAVGASMSIIVLISSIVSLISSTVLLMSFHYLLAIIIIFISVPYLLKLYLNTKRVELEIQLSPKRLEATEYTNYITKYEYIKETYFWNLSKLFINKWLSVMNKINEEEVDLNRKILLYEFLLDSVNYTGYVMSILLSVVFIIQGKIEIGQFGAIVYLLGEVNVKVEMFFRLISDLHEELLNVNKGFEYLDLLEEIRLSSITPSINKYITSTNKTFVYPMTKNTTVENLNINLYKNEIIALVGLNGAGKTTITKLLLGIITPTSGSIKYDDIDISEINYSTLYKNVSAVFQDFGKYFLNIRDNICLSDIERRNDLKLITEVSEKIGCLKWIHDLPKGYDTLLGKSYGGQDLSGGQWQQLALARAYYKSSQLIVLDEPTSALDPFNEELLYKNFVELCKGKIGIIVTHRIGAASLADKILLIEDGCVKESGNHDELMKMKGKYYNMFTIQSNMYK